MTPLNYHFERNIKIAVATFRRVGTNYLHAVCVLIFLIILLCAWTAEIAYIESGIIFLGGATLTILFWFCERINQSNSF